MIAQDIKILRGDDETLQSIVTLNNTAFNLTDCNLWFTVKKSLRDSDEDALFQKTLDNSGIEIRDAVSGEISIYINQLDTANLQIPENLVERDVIDFIDEYYYDLQVLTPSGNIYTAARGRFLVAFDVTLSN
jgi:hypothetical protein